MRRMIGKIAAASGIATCGIFVAAIAQQQFASVHDTAAEIITRRSESSMSDELRNALYFATAGHAHLADAHALILNPEIAEPGQLVEAGLGDLVTQAESSYANAGAAFDHIAQQAKGEAFKDDVIASLQRLGYPTDPAELAASFATTSTAIAALLSTGVIARNEAGTVKVITAAETMEVQATDALGAAMGLANALDTAILVIGPISGVGLVGIR